MTAGQTGSFSLARMKQWMSDADWLRKPILYFSANAARAMGGTAPPGQVFQVKV